MPSLSDAVALIVTLAGAVNVAPLAGELIETVGGLFEVPPDDLSAMHILPCTDDVERVAVVVPTAPAVALTPVANANPPPLPLVEPPSTRSVKLVRPELVQLPACAEVVSVASETIATTSVFATVVVTVGIETDVLAVEATPPAVTSHGLPDAITPRNVMILAI